MPAYVVVQIDVEDPVRYAEAAEAFADAEPVGTGPYIVDNVSTSAYTIVANPEYREEGKPAVKKVRYLGIEMGRSVKLMMFEPLSHRIAQRRSHEQVHHR